MTADTLRRLQALRGLTRTGSTHTVLAAVQGDLQTVIEAVLELADENTPSASRNGPQGARNADSGTGGPPEPENAVQGRIGWLRLKPGDQRRLLTREAPGGWTDNDLADDDPLWLRENYPDAEFEPIRTLADDEVAVKRDDLQWAVDVGRLSGPGGTMKRLRAALEAAAARAPREAYDPVWDPSVPPGGFVCNICRFPVESEPCADHGPDEDDALDAGEGRG